MHTTRQHVNASIHVEVLFIDTWAPLEQELCYVYLAVRVCHVQCMYYLLTLNENYFGKYLNVDGFVYTFA